MFAVTRFVSSFQHADMMRFAFNQVCDHTDWKNPIDAYVPWDLANVYVQAIEFMTALKPSCVRLTIDQEEKMELIRNASGWARLTCVGYRAGPAGP